MVRRNKLQMDLMDAAAQPGGAAECDWPFGTVNALLRADLIKQAGVAHVKLPTGLLQPTARLVITSKGALELTKRTRPDTTQKMTLRQLRDAVRDVRDMLREWRGRADAGATQNIDILLDRIKGF